MADENPLTILHLSDMQFGKNHRFKADSTLGDNPFDTLLARMIHDLDDLRESERVKPDLLICTGDLAEWGLKSEFRAAFDFLGNVAKHLGLGRDRVVVIPGNHDLNRKDCEAYFIQCDGDEAKPAFPWFPKWNKYDAAFDEFYKDCPGIAFSPDQPWSLFLVPELSVAVAGLNSTMRDGHDKAVAGFPPGEQGHYGWCGELQLRWYEKELSASKVRGWLRVGTVHHNQQRGCKDDSENLRDADMLESVLGDCLDMLLHGHAHQAKSGWIHPGLPVYSTGSAALDLASQARPPEIPNQYQILQVFRNRIRRLTRGYYPERGKWGADPRGSKSLNDWITEDRIDYSKADACFPAEATPQDKKLDEREGDLKTDRERGSRDGARTDDFLTRVAEACALRHEKAKIEEVRRPAEGLNYLRVICQESGIIRQFPVGTATHGCSLEDLDRFHDQVVAQYRAIDAGLLADFVYGGEAANTEARNHANRLGLRLLSFVEYQGLIDFREYLARQTDRLESDPVYPSALYVPQRMEFEIGIDRAFTQNAFDTVSGWLRETEPRFILILGEFGTGKTFLLCELARKLGTTLTIAPILVELRALEKAGSVNQLLAGHFARHPMDRIYADDRLRYMIQQGRVALLFDGFDELALRVGFERAADHLETLIQAAEGSARIVVTSRTSHFENDKQVRRRLGEDVGRVRGLRYCRLQRFDEEQIRHFLCNRFKTAGEAVIWFELIREVKDLLGLSGIPRMLSFITALKREDLEKARRAGGAVSAADLYRLLIVGHWLEHEYKRVNVPGAAELFSREQLLAATTQLALELWKRTDRWISLSELAVETERILGKMAPEKLPYHAAATQQLGSGTLLVRDNDGRFTFVHQSILEWLVADAAARELGDGGNPECLMMHEISLLMADFVVSLAGEGVAKWAATVAGASSGRTQAAIKNALLILDRAVAAVDGREIRVARDAAAGALKLAGQSLRGQDFTGQGLAEADLHGSDLRDASFTGKTLGGANLAGACLTGAKFDGANLTGADLTDADASNASFLGSDLRGAKLSGSRWRRARLLGAKFDEGALAGLDTVGAALGDVSALASSHARVGSPANCAAWSPDDTLIASGHGDGSVRIWDAASGRELLRCEGHSDWVRSVAWNRAKDRLASASDDQTIRIWDAASGRELLRCEGHSDWVWGVAWNQEGDRLASASDDQTIRIWDAASGRELLRCEGHSDYVRSVAWNHAGDRLASASNDQSVRLWDAASGRELLRCEGHSDTVWSVAWNPGGDRLASASADQTVRLWDAASGRELLRCEGHSDFVVSVAWNAEGDRLASASADSTVRLWDAASGRELLRCEGHSDSVVSVAWNQAGDRLASASEDQTVRIWDAALGRELLRCEAHSAAVVSVAWNQAGDRLASGSDDQTVRIWDAASGRELLRCEGHSHSVRSVAWNQAGDWLASGSDDQSVRIWDAASGRELLRCEGHSDSVLSVAWKPGGDRLASASADQTIRIWDAASGRELLRFDGHSDSVVSVAWNAEGDRLASASADNTVRLWDAASGRELLRCAGHSDSVLSVAWNPRGERLASASADNTVRLWDAASGRELLRCEGHSDSVLSVAWNSGGDRLASASADNTVRLWDAASGRELLRCEGHPAYICSVAWNPAEDRLASASNDATIRIWRADTGKCLAVIVPAEEGWAVFRPDGRYRSGGNVSGAFWHRAGLCRFEVGELDAVFPRLRLADGEALF